MAQRAWSAAPLRLAVVTLLALVALLGAYLVLPGTAPVRAAESDPENVAKIRELGGDVDYGTVGADGRRSGITATITPAIVKAAKDDEVGSPADSDIRPPGFEDLPEDNRSRGHLLGRQLGGSGKVDANLVALFQTRANSPSMSGFENDMADAIDAGETVEYKVTPIYQDGGRPESVRMVAKGDRGFGFDVEIRNTPEGEVIEHADPGNLFDGRQAA